MSDNPYYDGAKLLSLQDIDGNKPEIYIVTTNRSAGKTTYFNRREINRFLKHGNKFMLLYRYSYELDDIPNKFFGEIKELFFQKYDMIAEKKCQGKYVELFLVELDANNEPIKGSEQSCGYAVALNDSDKIKKMSHLFKDVSEIIFDEFQSEENKYLSKEIIKFRSIHTSVARGGGKQVRYVPVIMISNTVSIMNPYYCAWNISHRLSIQAKFVRGTGWVLEQGYNEAASKANQESAFNRAFGDCLYSRYQTMGVYLNDSTNFIEKPKGELTYYATVKYMDNSFGIKYCEEGYYYVDDKPDLTYPICWAFTTPDHDPNTVLLQKGSFIMTHLRNLFNNGQFRFKNLSCKEALFYGIGKTLYS